MGASMRRLLLEPDGDSLTFYSLPPEIGETLLRRRGLLLGLLMQRIYSLEEEVPAL